MKRDYALFTISALIALLQIAGLFIINDLRSRIERIENKFINPGGSHGVVTVYRG